MPHLQNCDHSDDGWCLDCVKTLYDEAERLQSGRLTPEEFHELCHNLHEHGTPITREEHRVACERFRDFLFGPSEVVR